ncbi:hypothetical protein ACMA1D_20395 [Streptomyces sp. 796.1]|uniref:hypothetical protein n=1 Tax=Streptomyces sp. 796.1 TaxID=3163029 RepID=UPI0039C9CA41
MTVPHHRSPRPGPRPRPRDVRRRARAAQVPAPADFATVDLDHDGWLLAPDTGEPVPADRLVDHLAHWLRPPEWATDILVYAHGWQTGQPAALRNAQRLLALVHQQHARHPRLYPRLHTAAGYAPWTVVVRWPSSSQRLRKGYYAVRDRAHAMSAPGRGFAPHVLGHLLGYLDAERGDPRADTLRTATGRYLHLIGHSFGGRFLCEAVQWAADAAAGDTLGWSIATDPGRPFTVDSLTAFQMAAPSNAFDGTFRTLRPATGGHRAPVGGPMVFTHSRHDHATGYCHLHAEHLPGIGHGGMRLSPARGDLAPNDVAHTDLHPADRPYARACLDHPFVNVNASWRYRNSPLNPLRAHSDYFHPESAHLLLSLAEWSRP